jgi:hypothetical protein
VRLLRIVRLRLILILILRLILRLILINNSTYRFVKLANLTNSSYSIIYISSTGLLSLIATPLAKYNPVSLYRAF